MDCGGGFNVGGSELSCLTDTFRNYRVYAVFGGFLSLSILIGCSGGLYQANGDFGGPASANGEPDSAPGAPILESVYGFLSKTGSEPKGYGLYSYALFPARSPRADAFLEALFARTGAASESEIKPANLNIIYLPVSLDLESGVGAFMWDPDNPDPGLAAKAYAYPKARMLLAQICLVPAEGVRDLCAGDLSRGPYLLTYSKPSSALETVPPPYLVLDLSGVHHKAFANFIAAYKAQVKRTDYTDRERIDAFNLVLLNVTLHASDVVSPVVESVKDLVSLVLNEE